jgi:hypothetical protein
LSRVAAFRHGPDPDSRPYDRLVLRESKGRTIWTVLACEKSNARFLVVEADRRQRLLEERDVVAHVVERRRGTGLSPDRLPICRSIGRALGEVESHCRIVWFSSDVSCMSWEIRSPAHWMLL